MILFKDNVLNALLVVLVLNKDVLDVKTILSELFLLIPKMNIFANARVMLLKVSEVFASV